METIKLLSSDGIEFTIKRKIALYSKTLNLLINTNPNYIEHVAEAIVLPINSKYLARIIEFLEFKASNKNVDDFEIKDDETVDLLDAAAYLRI
ncbi:skp1 component [Vairimorpha ceranae]|uniref:Elongin-C n=1 Tax=Vairimorpha ceranae TaxID=40302 RepID=A0A0F9WBS0_9MICR|nr:skp1 component [Vairimorpha ceranae]KAF5140760.1 hypothetical protein G9O61_00g010800 [Vairimorpha ceranae]KKO74961.1 skp1 component [Vairimorpha ceranae]